VAGPLIFDLCKIIPSPVDVFFLLLWVKTMVILNLLALFSCCGLDMHVGGETSESYSKIHNGVQPKSMHKVMQRERCHGDTGISF